MAEGTESSFNGVELAHVAEVQLSTRRVVVVRVMGIDGKLAIDVRSFTPWDRGADGVELRPTGKGVWIPFDPEVDGFGNASLIGQALMDADELARQMLRGNDAEPVAEVVAAG